MVILKAMDILRNIDALIMENETYDITAGVWLIFAEISRFIDKNAE